MVQNWPKIALMRIFSSHTMVHSAQWENLTKFLTLDKNQLRYFENATKFEKKYLYHFETSKKWEIFFKILWPSQNISTLSKREGWTQSKFDDENTLKKFCNVLWERRGEKKILSKRIMCNGVQVFLCGQKSSPGMQTVLFSRL